MDLANQARFSRQITGAAMVAAPLVIVAAELLHARVEMDAEQQLTAVAEHTGRWYAAHLLVLLAVALALPAFFGLVHLVRRGRPALANLSLVLFVPGAVTLAAAAGMEFVLWQMAQPERNRAEMVALADRLNESAGILPLWAILLLFPISWLLAGIGLYLARAAPAWAAAAVAVAQPVGFVSELSGGPRAIAIAAQAVFALGLVPIGLRVLQQPDEEWEAGYEAPAIAPPASPAAS